MISGCSDRKSCHFLESTSRTSKELALMNGYFRMSLLIEKRYIALLLAVIIIIFFSTTLYAQSSGEIIQLSYSNSLLTLTAENADLKNILIRISDEVGIYVRFPDDLKKQVTLELSEVSLNRALKKILKGINHAVIYRFSKKEQKSVISRIYVFEEAKSAPMSRSEQRTSNFIKNYESRIESLKKKLEKVDENSSRGKGYLRQIKSYETRIERLKARLR